MKLPMLALPQCKKTLTSACLFIFAIFISTFFIHEVHAQSASVAPYNLSKAPSAMKGLNIPDFLAFVTNNKEKTPLSAMVKGFFPAEISCAFDLKEPYFTKYASKIASYARLLESQGFKFSAGWEGYYHFDKKWKGYYAMVTVGSYDYDTRGIQISITLTKDKYSFPTHHNASPYAE